MPLPFDATLKDIAKDDPTAFVSAFDAPPAGPVSILNVDLSTVTAAADLVFGIGDPLAEVIRRILAGLQGELEPSRYRRLAAAAYLLTGIQVKRERAKSMFLGVQGMQDSDTYQAILDEGRQEGLQKGLQEGRQEGLQKG